MDPIKPESKPRLSAGLARARQREPEAVKLYLAGLTFDEIAEKLGYSDRSGARKAVHRALERDVPEVEGLRAKLLADADVVIERLLPLVDREDPDLKATDRFMRAIDLKARLGGVYRPEAPTVTNNVAITLTSLEEHGRRQLAARALPAGSGPSLELIEAST